MFGVLFHFISLQVDTGETVLRGPIRVKVRVKVRVRFRVRTMFWSVDPGI